MPCPKSAKNNHLPPRMYGRRLKSGAIRYYYCTTDGKKIPLGADLSAAKLQWAQLESTGTIVKSDNFKAVTAAYKRESIPGKATKTQRQYELAINRLDIAFGSASLPQIQPHHCRQYLDRSAAKVRANRDMAVLSAVFNWARERGITNAQNPMIGVRRNREVPREVYVTDEEFRALWLHAAPELQDALDIARLTGQRVGDVIKMHRADISDGHLWVRQDKTGARLGIEVTGELSQIIERAKSRTRAATGLYLVQTQDGKRLSYTMLRDRFDAAREASGQRWQFRDLRPKAATDLDDVKAAKDLLGHKSETTTARIYRRLKGEKVQPVGGSKLKN